MSINTPSFNATSFTTASSVPSPRMSPRSAGRRIAAVLGVCLLAPMTLTGMAQAESRSGVPDMQIRVERSLTLTVDDPLGSGWQGTMRISRIGQVDETRGRLRYVWRSGPLHLRLQRIDCAMAGCLTTVISVPQQPPVVVPSRVAPGLSDAGMNSRIVPVLVERLEGDRVISSRLAVIRLDVQAVAIGSVSAESTTWIDQVVERRHRIRQTAAEGIVGVTMTPSIMGSPDSVDSGRQEIPAAAGTISVRRTTITTRAPRSAE